ncbi:glycosyltransferase family 4 protein [bacterium]|nr:glycosyltransferase family 4 protein [bacterium]
MKVIITHPFCWPAVRRGTERFIAELAQHLVPYGHDVVTLSSTPGPSTWEDVPEAGRRYLVHHSFPSWMNRLRLQPTDPFIWKTIGPLLRIPSDVVHCLYHTDAISAIATRSIKRHKVILQIQGVPLPLTFRRLPPERSLTKMAVHRADRCVVISKFCQEKLRENYGVDAPVINLPVNTNHFTPLDRPKTGPPTILSAASFKDRRKGVRTLVRAFVMIKNDVPDAVLQLSGEITPEIEAELDTLVPSTIRQDVHVLGVGHLTDLPKLYREATITCLPSMWEAFGMVVLESWASGTPVVVTRHGAFPELIEDNPHLGAMFDPKTEGFETTNAEGLAEALLEGLKIASTPGVTEQCRAKSLTCSWDRLGPQFEALYHEVT